MGGLIGPVSTGTHAGPVPTGTATKDTAAVQAALNAAATAGTTAIITQPGTFVYDAALTVKCSVIWGGPTQVHQAGASLPATAPLMTVTTAARRVFVGSPVFDANGHAVHSFSLPSASTKLTWLGAPLFRNATQTEVVIASGGYRHIGEMRFGRTTGTAASGYASLRITASDCIIDKAGGSGQETAVWAGGSDNTVRDVHFSNPPILQTIRDTGRGNRFGNPMGDSNASKTHAGATGSTASTVITDATIRASHQGIRVTGTNIPATSFVGTVTSGTSFVLVNASGTGVHPTGAVSGITLTATFFNLQGQGGQIAGGLSQVNVTGSSPADAFNIGPSVTEPYSIGPHYLWGHNPTTKAVGNTFVGNYAAGARWHDLTQVDVTNAVSPTSSPITAETPAAGVALINGTQTIISAVVPDDGQVHVVNAFMTKNVTAALTGGSTDIFHKKPNGAGSNTKTTALTVAVHTKTVTGTVQPGSVVTVSQTTAMTAGAGTVYAKIVII